MLEIVLVIIAAISVFVGIPLGIYLRKRSKKYPDATNEKRKSEIIKLSQQIEQSDLYLKKLYLDDLHKTTDELKQKALKNGLEALKNHKYEDAREYFRSILSRNPSLPERVAAFNLVGLSFYHQNRLQEALGSYFESLNNAKKQNDKIGTGIALGNIGNIYQDIGQPDEALKYHNDSLKIYRGIGDQEGIVNQLGYTGNIYQFLGKPKSALKYYNEALEISRQIGYKHGSAIQIGNIGNTCKFLGRPKEALKYYNDALEISRQIDYEQNVAILIGNIGNIYQDLGQLDEAMKYYNDALDISRKIGYEQNVTALIGKIGAIYHNLG